MKFTGERVTDEMSTRPDILQEHIARYNFALRYVANKIVLDAACGTGYGVDLMSKVARKVDGCDVSIEAINSARGRYPDNDFFIDDLNSPRHKENYQVITSFETIEHLDKPEEFLKWAKEHGDMLVFSVPVNMPSEFHKQVWSIDEIKDMIRKHFSRVVFYSQIGMNFYTLNDTATYVVGVAER